MQIIKNLSWQLEVAPLWFHCGRSRLFILKRIEDLFTR